LTLTLNSLASQDFPPQNFEILIIDNGSTDNTKQVAERFIDQFPTLTVRYIFEPEPGLLSGRHRGALEAEGKILVFIDDDIEADRNWLKAIDSSFADPSVHLVGGRNLPKYETPPPDWLAWFWDEHEYGKFCGSLSLLDFGHQVREIDPEFVWGLNYSIRKDTLFVLGGFHPDCVPANLQQFQGDGETGLSIKAREKGYGAIYQPNALVNIWQGISFIRPLYSKILLCWHGC
jgi:glycosyltransferase involved in cell wall biosynthesis